MNLTNIKSKTADLIRKMMEDADLEKILETMNLTRIQAARIMRRASARQQLRAARRLSRIHHDMLMCRYAPTMVQKLILLMKDEKPEIRLKSAIALIELTRLGRSKRQARPTKVAAPAYEPLDVTDAEAGEILSVMADTFDKRRAAEKIKRAK